MTTTHALLYGFRRALARPRLVLLLWLVPFVPSALIAAMASAALTDLDQSPFAGQILDGRWYGPWTDLRHAYPDHLSAMLSAGLIATFALAVVLQAIVDAGLAEVVLERRAARPFLTGVRRNSGRFIRASAWFVLGLGLCAIGPVLVARAGFHFAESRSDGRIDLIGLAIAGGLFAILWAPLAMAFTQSRLAAVFHDEGSMFRGLLRGVVHVTRHGGRFGLMAAATVGIPVVLHAGYGLIRSPWTPSTTVAIVALLILQQTLMLFRAVVRLGLWGAQASLYRDLETPKLARSGRRRHRHSKGPLETAEPPGAVDPSLAASTAE